MSDAISELYAKIGFKVDDKELQKVKTLLTGVADQLTRFNSVTRDAASSYGILSDKQIKLEQQKIRQSTEWWKHHNKTIDLTKQREHQQFVERQQRYKEDIETKKKNAIEEGKIEQRLTATQKSENEKRINLTKTLATTFKRIKQIIGAGSWTYNALRRFIGDSTERAIETRDFMRYTGTSFNALQDIEERFARIGSSMSRNDILGELSNVMSNITDINFGQGNLFGFKLAGLGQVDYRKNVGRLIDDIKYGLLDVAPQERVKVLNELGLTGQRWMAFFDEQIKGVNGTRIPRVSLGEQKQLEEAQGHFKTLNLAIERTKDKFNAVLAPAVAQLSKSFYNLVDEFFRSGAGKNLSSAVTKKIKDIEEWAKGLTQEDLENTAKSINEFASSAKEFFSYLGVLVKVFNYAGRFIKHFKKEFSDAFESFFDYLMGNKRDISERLKRSQEQVNNIIEAGKRGFKGYKEGEEMSENMANVVFGRSIADAKKFYENYTAMSKKDGVSGVSDPQPQWINKYINNQNKPSTTPLPVSVNNTYNNNTTVNGVEQKEIADKTAEAIDVRNQKLAEYNNTFVLSGYGAGYA